MRNTVLMFLFILFCVHFISFISLGENSKSFAKEFNVIKFATIAPENSAWANVLKDIDIELKEKSQGKLRLKIYAGGVQGDDKDVLRKMRIGQLHGASFMTTGLSQILPSARIFDLPFCFKNYKEIDIVKSQLNSTFVKAFEEEGYVLLGWTEAGFIYFFSNTPIRSLSDLRSTKMWMWEGDRLAKALFDSINISPISVSIIDVMTSLQTGLIDSVYASPLSIIAFQWFTKVKYMLDMSVANPTIAILLTKKSYDKLSTKLQKVLLTTFKKHEKRLTEMIREDNEKSRAVLKNHGIKFISLNNKEAIDEFKKVGEETSKLLTGKLFSRDLLELVMNELHNIKNK